jgi:hypothetical protein
MFPLPATVVRFTTEMHNRAFCFLCFVPLPVPTVPQLAPFTPAEELEDGLPMGLDLNGFLRQRQRN